MHRVILKRHLESAFQQAKPSTSDTARDEYEAMYGAFSKSRTTDFAIANAQVDTDALHQRTALA